MAETLDVPTEAPFAALADRSASIGKLAGALAKAQSDIRAAEKDRENPFFKASYATLASCWAACRDHLGKHGLSVIQVPQQEGDRLMLFTYLAHESGEWMRSRYPVNPVKADPQGLGSAVTYARRYALAAMVGVYSSDEDDDGEAAMARDDRRPSKPAPVRPAPPAQNGEVATGAAKSQNGAQSEKPTEPPPASEPVKASLSTLKAEIDAAKEAGDLKGLLDVAQKIAKQPKNIQTALVPVYNAAKHAVEAAKEAAKKAGANGSGKQVEV